MDAFLHTLSSLASVGIFAAAFGGVLWGIFGGALPGISPSIAMALLLPFTVGMDPTTAIVLLASVYVGAEYGGSIPAILIRTPGTNSAAATVTDRVSLVLLVLAALLTAYTLWKELKPVKPAHPMEARA